MAYSAEGNRAKVLTRERERRNKLLLFLRLHHVHCFGSSYLSWYLEIPEFDVIALCEGFILQGYVFKPNGTSYYQGVEPVYPRDRAVMAELFEEVT